MQNTPNNQNGPDKEGSETMNRSGGGKSEDKNDMKRNSSFPGQEKTERDNEDNPNRFGYVPGESEERDTNDRDLLQDREEQKETRDV